ncbi:MAG: polysaccharide deacetylase, partial [Myxococcota bacterium]|nr:polysaccharide deacetylase [Myxococcota bacterium]
SGVDPALEGERVKACVETLRELSGQPVLGWLSPGKSQSFNTPDLLAANGVRYMCDWVNDALPYPFRTKNGGLIALPLSTELEDTHILIQNQHSEQSYVEQVEDACGFLRREATHKGGRILALSIHPWLMGQPHRIGKLDALLKSITAHDDVWCATASEVISACGDQL